MNKGLTIEHLAAYLPYGMKCHAMGMTLDGLEPSHPITFDVVGLGEFVELHESGRTITEHFVYSDVFPLLRPLSQLTETIEHGGERFVPVQHIDEMGFRVHPLTYESIGVFSLPYWVVSELHSLHFDTFGLIEAGLAEPIPSIPQP